MQPDLNYANMQIKQKENQVGRLVERSKERVKEVQLVLAVTPLT